MTNLGRGVDHVSVARVDAVDEGRLRRSRCLVLPVAGLAMRKIFEADTAEPSRQALTAPKRLLGVDHDVGPISPTGSAGYHRRPPTRRR